MYKAQSHQRIGTESSDNGVNRDQPLRDSLFGPNLVEGRRNNADCGSQMKL